jgi:multiple sugar transport system permease protein
VVSTLAAYGLARMGLRARWISLVIFVFLFIRFYPRITTVIPYFLVMRQFSLLDTVWAIAIGHLGITIPFVTWLMLIVFQDLPIEVEEAAMVDGAGPWQRFWTVALPMAAPGVASAAILTAFLSWNEFLIASSVAKRQAQVLSIAVASFVTDKGVQWGPMAATAVVMIVPMILFALFVQRYLVRGITLGAVKG